MRISVSPGLIWWVYQTLVKCGDHVILRNHASERFPRFSSFIFLCDMLKGALPVILALFHFAKGVSSGRAHQT